MLLLSCHRFSFHPPIGQFSPKTSYLRQVFGMYANSPKAASLRRFLVLAFTLLLAVSFLMFGPTSLATANPGSEQETIGQQAPYPSEIEIHQTLAKYASQNQDGSVRYDVQAAAADNVDSRIVEIGDLVNRLEQDSVTSPGQAQPNDLNPTNYGRWCGKNNSGPGDPIDELDRACMGHDHCLNIGRPTCDCDREFVNRLRQIRGQFSGWARTYLEAAIIAVPRWHGCRV